MNQYYLSELQPGTQAVISSLNITGSMRRRLLDLGLIENTNIKCLFRSPSGDPSAYLIRETVIALRRDISCQICIIHHPEETSII